MAKAIRVLRLIEYTYDSVEVMEADVTHWTNANGSWRPNERTLIKSATMSLETVLPLDKDEDEG
jgi:hypothetical protein